MDEFLVAALWRRNGVEGQAHDHWEALIRPSDEDASLVLSLLTCTSMQSTDLQPGLTSRCMNRSTDATHTSAWIKANIWEWIHVRDFGHWGACLVSRVPSRLQPVEKVEAKKKKKSVYLLNNIINAFSMNMFIIILLWLTVCANFHFLIILIENVIGQLLFWAYFLLQISSI